MSKPPAKRQSAPPKPIPSLEGEIEAALRDTVPNSRLHDLTERVTQIAIGEQFSGPLPHPRHLAEYEQNHPGAANRIITMAEQSLGSHIALRDKALSADIAEGKLGMIYGAGIFVLLILCALASHLITGSVAVPGLFLGAAAIGGVAAFIKGRNGGKP